MSLLEKIKEINNINNKNNEIEIKKNSIENKIIFLLVFFMVLFIVGNIGIFFADILPTEHLSVKNSKALLGAFFSLSTTSLFFYLQILLNKKMNQLEKSKNNISKLDIEDNIDLYLTEVRELNRLNKLNEVPKEILEEIYDAHYKKEKEKLALEESIEIL